MKTLRKKSEGLNLIQKGQKEAAGKLKKPGSILLFF
jgi:hypothetical protein|tara:strand:- start:1193 stop:1300 length:108 start_codon:yes stop_codon:yes gene_type:complete